MIRTALHPAVTRATIDGEDNQPTSARWPTHWANSELALRPPVLRPSPTGATVAKGRGPAHRPPTGTFQLARADQPIRAPRTGALSVLTWLGWEPPRLDTGDRLADRIDATFLRI